MSDRTLEQNKQAGFTLVELAIVLVIIGLIVGGILVGQDLIKSAEIRATITQLERNNAAATTFRDKFGGLPGDLVASRVTQFGLTPARANTAGQGNGDGLIQGTAAAPAALIGETFAFWSDLTQAQFISQPVNALANMTTAATITEVGALPETRLREFSRFHVFSAQGRNFFYLGAISAVNGTGDLTLANGITPREAFNIDEKLDNGDADEGIVQAVSAIQPITEPAGAGVNDGSATACLADANGLYNTDGSDGDAINCSISVRGSF